ncbi:MAG TPA: hypothetical protein VGI39_32550 [Polyangiaceae bacterium]|jgi:hypothetical protein
MSHTRRLRPWFFGAAPLTLAALASLASTGCSSGAAGDTPASPPARRTSQLTLRNADRTGSAPVREGLARAEALESAESEPCPPAFVQAPHPHLPLVLNQGGPVVTKPLLMSVTFRGSYTDRVSDLDEFVKTFGGQPYWKAARQYGVSAPHARAAVHLADEAPGAIDDAGIQAFLAAKFAAPDAPLGAPSADSLIVLFFPSATTITAPAGASCVSFDAYHGSAPITVNGQSIVVPYAVVPECLKPTQGLSVRDSVTASASHEILEASTDPRVGEASAFSGTGINTGNFDPYAVWAYGVEGDLSFLELSDMCERGDSSIFTPPHFPFAVQRFWSNEAVLAGHDPCTPTRPADKRYFAAVPVFDPDFAVHEAETPPVYLPVVTITDGFGSTPFPFQTQGVKIPVGGSATIPVALFSDGPVGDWTVSAADETLKPGATPNVSFDWDKTTGNNGDVLHLTIHVLGVDPLIGGQSFSITSTRGAEAHMVFGFVGQN